MFKKVHWVHGTWSDIASALLSNELRSHSESGQGCEVSRRCEHKWNLLTNICLRTRKILYPSESLVLTIFNCFFLLLTYFWTQARSTCLLILLFFYSLSFVVGTDFWDTSKHFFDYSYLSNRRVYQLSMQGDIFVKKC